VDRVGIAILAAAGVVCGAVVGFAPRAHVVHASTSVTGTGVHAIAGKYQGVPAIAQVAMRDGELLTLVAYPTRDGRLCIGLGRAQHNAEYVQHCAGPKDLPIVLAEANGAGTGARAIIVIGPKGSRKVTVPGLGGMELPVFNHALLVAPVASVSLAGYRVTIDGHSYGTLHALRVVTPCPAAKTHPVTMTAAPVLCGTS
jgi:hypothetical protein